MSKDHRGAWRQQTDWQTVVARAGGRRRYNSWRGQMAILRRARVVRLLHIHGGLGHRGAQARVARELGVSQATVSRDVKAITPTLTRCRTCCQMVPA